MKGDIQEPAGPLQTATGLKAGEEAAIHLVRLIFEDSATEAVILVDPNNTFSSIRAVLNGRIKPSQIKFWYFGLNGISKIKCKI